MVDDQAYTIVNPLGKGGFGTVMKVFDSLQNKYYALKVPLIFDKLFSNNKAVSDEDIQESQKFLNHEIDTILDYMDETFIFIYKKGNSKVFSLGETVEFPVYIMELAEGSVLSFIRPGIEGNAISLPFEEKVKMIKEAVNSISHLHSMNVVHRDLSPDNIFVVDRGGKIAYVLGDFGASKELYQMKSTNKSSKIVGHSAYLDPARFIEANRYDFRIDLYSLGIIITEILMGNLWSNIVGEENIPHIAAFDFENDFLLTEGKKYINNDLLNILRKAVKREINERYKSIDELRKDLFQILDIDSKKGTELPGTVMENMKQEEEPDTKKITFDFYFKIPIPFSSAGQTFAQDIIEYKQEKEIELSDYHGAKIVIKDFSPQKVIIKDTTLYAAMIVENSILLNFKNSAFLKFQQAVARKKDTLKGELFFKGTIELEGN
jgi:serine/threonine protein kinase